MTDDQLLELLTLDHTIDRYGALRYRLNGKLHRDDGPAAIYANGSEYWYQNGQLHRDDGPAVTHIDGTEMWCQHGEFIK